MSAEELEGRLLALGTDLDFPAPPDLVPGVLARLQGARRSRRPSLRTVAVALAVLLALASTAIAVPATRHAILRVLGLRGVRIERVGHLPPAAAARLGLGRPIALDRARHAAGFSALLPPGPATAYLERDVPGGRISVLAGHALIIEFRGTAIPFVLKLIGPGTRVEQLRVNGGPGLYIFGTPHELLFETANGTFQPDRVRLAGHVLLWQQGPVTIRIEGAGTLRDALALARSLR